MGGGGGGVCLHLAGEANRVRHHPRFGTPLLLPLVPVALPGTSTMISGLPAVVKTNGMKECASVGSRCHCDGVYDLPHFLPMIFFFPTFHYVMPSSGPHVARTGTRSSVH